jgi:hypothetical protein
MKNEIAKIIAEYLNKVESPQEKWDAPEILVSVYTGAAERLEELNCKTF